MTREWKPGDVAMVTDPVHGRHVALRLSDCWHLAVEGDQTRCLAGDAAEDVSPLVVIDPGDRDLIARVADRFVEAWQTGMTQTPAMRAAFRSLITPPRPDEPTGLGAVVEDEDGGIWVRCDETENNYDRPWHGPEQSAREYGHITAVRILSEGVKP